MHDDRYVMLYALYFMHDGLDGGKNTLPLA